MAENQYSSLVKQMQDEDLERAGVKADKVRQFHISTTIKIRFVLLLLLLLRHKIVAP